MSKNPFQHIDLRVNDHEVAWEFFGTDEAKEAVRKKVVSKFPEHEVEEFTEHFWGLIQFWRKTEAERIGLEGEAG